MIFNFFKRIVKPPIFDSEVDTHQAFMLNAILWGLILMPIPYVVFVQIAMPESAGRAWIQAGFGETINIFLLILMHRGYVRAASIIQVISFWLFFTFIAFTGSGVQDEAYLFGYPLVILIAGLLLGANPALWLTALILSIGLVMVYQSNIGNIQPTVSSSPPFTWMISFVIFPAIALLQYLSSRTLTEALEQVRLSDEKQKLISKVSSDYTFESVVDEKGNAKLLWVAGAFEKMTGYSREEYTATGGWSAHIHPDDREKDDEDMQKLLRNEDVIYSEIRTFTKNREIRWERVFAHPVWSKKENRLVGIVGAVQDVTRQKIAEENLKETLLQQVAILNNIPDMAWMKDKQGRYIAVNEQFLRDMHFQLEEIIGKTDLDVFEQERAKFYREGDRKVMETKQRLMIEEQFTDSNGNISWAETTKTPIINSVGEVIGTTGMSRGITERKSADLERERLIKELEAKNTELERFTYTVSHDLKSPLVTITGFLIYLERDARAGNFEKFNKDLERIHKAVAKMQTLLKDLLELSRVGRIMNDPIEIGFGEIVHEVLTLVDGNIKAKNVKVEFIDQGHKIYGDRIRLVEVLQNLIENAIKFMGEQENPLIRIGVITNQKNKSTFFVEDNGVGIESQFIDRIFGLFNKLDIDSPGSGIGLTIVKRIIEVHGGEVWVESQPGKGSTFYFTLS